MKRARGLVGHHLGLGFERQKYSDTSLAALKSSLYLYYCLLAALLLRKETHLRTGKLPPPFYALFNVVNSLFCSCVSFDSWLANNLG